MYCVCPSPNSLDEGKGKERVRERTSCLGQLTSSMHVLLQCSEQLVCDSQLLVCMYDMLSMNMNSHFHTSCLLFLHTHNPLQLSVTEAANIARCFKSKDFTAFMSGGIHAENTKFQFLREEDKKTVYGKRKGAGAITLQASKTAIVIAHMPEGGQQGNTNKGVAVIAEYLESMNM